MFRRILVGYDGSAQADRALALAERLCERDGELILVCAYPFFRSLALPAVLAPQTYKAQAEELLERAADTVAPWLRRRTWTVGEPSVPRALSDAAADAGAELIVVGASRSRSPARGGTKAPQLVHRGRCAVAVAAGGRPGPLQRIGVAYDGGPEARAALSTAFAIAEDTGAKVVVCEAVEVLELGATSRGAGVRALTAAARKRVTGAASSVPAGVAVETKVVRGFPLHRALADAMADVDLLLCGSRRDGPVRRVVLGSVSARLLASARTPVLVTAPPQDVRRPDDARIAASVAP